MSASVIAWSAPMFLNCHRSWVIVRMYSAINWAGSCEHWYS
ncbi:hypothetical protein PF002_g8917 [Phytophthora fragariae]|uniref:Uncharacterized protein n=1 Tax=Phytophthora fragariae TaxID=53985 RepID=A0A6A3ZV65_9STRA|nr:hypothetical protein PF003_g18398 [Phytophthora fragariae]KAE9006780.1 hypothetical protein PF011_g11419 [Phytophthora fragariae]KAE9242093.1 hypothetical protein PF002_g8917 [Phytophthora fragariae]KAE9307003.1 hypothetical protein PF001_g11830 [Phytophthora fragariae]